MTSDLSMNKLFFSDLKSQVLQLENTLKELIDSSENKTEKLEFMLKLLLDIYSAAMLVQQTALAQSVKKTENFLKRNLEQTTPITTKEIEALAAFYKLLRQIAEENNTKGSGELEKLADSFKKEIKLEKESIVDESMMELFQNELSTQTHVLNDALVSLENTGYDRQEFDTLMRAAHSIKGAARVVNLESVVHLAHIIEDCFSSVLKKEINFEETDIDALFEAVDIFDKISKISRSILRTWIDQEKPRIENLISRLNRLFKKEQQQYPLPALEKVVEKVIEPPRESAEKETGRILRVTAQNLNRLMGLAGESMVESRWLNPFSESLLKLKKAQNDLANYLDQLRESLEGSATSELTQTTLSNVLHKTNECRQNLSDRLTELELFISRHSSLTDRLYAEVIDSRMRPFNDGVAGFPRMVRDMAKELGKKVRLLILGKSTPVDRDILEKLENPLSHLIRNSIDHGIEMPEERTAMGKPAEGTITIEARHRAGMLSITVSDDGRGINHEVLRRTIVERNLAKKNFADKLTQTELLDFLFLPGFSTASQITEISGRGIGLNIVQNMIQEVVGSVRIESVFGKGTSFIMHLPLTLSVIRAMIAEIAGESYAFPLSRIDQAVMVQKDDIQLIENRQYFHFAGQNIGLVPAYQVLGLQQEISANKMFPVIILNDRANSYGVVVDRYLGERELVVQEMDPRLGKIPNILSGAFMEDGTPVLIIDVEDMVRSIDVLLSGGRLQNLKYASETSPVAKVKNILVVDDSITVREVQCRLLRNKGYQVDTAVNGMDGWNAVRLGHYDLVITDVDMPRMNGIELVKAIKSDQRLKTLPVMIVSYKERESDRLAGLEAGANYYMTKSGFHDETLLDAVRDLIGKP